ncbi:MAG: hypothetical protein OJF47_003352 [Nitrospira sp.]|nr:MAG: hypothetical protein OJF47_003352 [Nitrospira sp.]
MQDFYQNDRCRRKTVVKDSRSVIFPLWSNRAGFLGILHRKDSLANGTR